MLVVACLLRCFVALACLEERGEQQEAQLVCWCSCLSWRWHWRWRNRALSRAVCYVVGVCLDAVKGIWKEFLVSVLPSVASLKSRPALLCESVLRVPCFRRLAFCCGCFCVGRFSPTDLRTLSIVLLICQFSDAASRISASLFDGVRCGGNFGVLSLVFCSCSLAR